MLRCNHCCVTGPKINKINIILTIPLHSKVTLLITDKWSKLSCNNIYYLLSQIPVSTSNVGSSLYVFCLKARSRWILKYAITSTHQHPVIQLQTSATIFIWPRLDFSCLYIKENVWICNISMAFSLNVDDLCSDKPSHVHSHGFWVLPKESELPLRRWRDDNGSSLLAVEWYMARA